MAFHNINQEIVTLIAGVNEFPSSGGTFVHQVYCIAPGTVIVNAVGGGQATFILTANEKVDIVTRRVEVSSGTFIGFKTLNPQA